MANSGSEISQFAVVYIGNHWQRRKQTIGVQRCAPPGPVTTHHGWLRVYEFLRQALKINIQNSYKELTKV